MRALYRQQTYMHGEYATVSLFPVFETGRKRGHRYRPTSDVQKRLNDFNARERLARQLDIHMRPGDGFWRLTYTDADLPESRRDAIKGYQAYKRRLARWFKREGLGELKMAAAFHGDVGGKRLHLHVVVNADVPPAVMAALWGCGSVEARPLYRTKTGFRGIAEYMMRGMEWGRVMTTRNLTDAEPVEKTGKISRSTVEAIHDAWDDKEAYEGLMPGYKIADVRPFFNWLNRNYYLRVYLYKEGLTL